MEIDHISTEINHITMAIDHIATEINYIATAINHFAIDNKIFSKSKTII
jgi:hypothetical protein